MITATCDPVTERFVVEAKILAAMGDPVRLRILYHLGLREHNVTALCGVTGKAQQAVSHHLTILKLRKLIELERRGKSNYYRLTEAGRQAMRRTALA